MKQSICAPPTMRVVPVKEWQIQQPEHQQKVPQPVWSVRGEPGYLVRQVVEATAWAVFLEHPGQLRLLKDGMVMAERGFCS